MSTSGSSRIASSTQPGSGCLGAKSHCVRVTLGRLRHDGATTDGPRGPGGDDQHLVGGGDLAAARRPRRGEQSAEDQSDRRGQDQDRQGGRPGAGAAVALRLSPERLAARPGDRTVASPHDPACDLDDRTHAHQESDPEPHRSLAPGTALQGSVDQGRIGVVGELPLPIDERLSLDGDLRLLTAIEQELTALDQLTAITAHQDGQIQLLMTLPGVNFVGAVGLLAALGDITRFKDGDHAAAYLGLTPSTHQSGKRCYHGHITKAGSNHARWLLTQGVQHVARHPGPLGVFFRRLAKRRNRNVAIVATARKLVTIAFLMLKHHEPYRYAKPELMRKKFRGLHYLATGERLPRQRSKRPRDLNEIYRAVGLPSVTSLHDLPQGERGMLENRKITDWVRQIHSAPQPTPTPPAALKTKSTGLIRGKDTTIHWLTPWPPVRADGGPSF